MILTINEARETGSQSTEQKFKQSGLTLAITSPVISALQTASNQLQAAGNTSSGRMQALAAANAGFNLKQGADAIKAGQGDINGQVPTGNKNPDGTPEMKDGNLADKAGVSCPSVRHTLRVELQSPLFQNPVAWGWFLMGLLRFALLRCACFCAISSTHAGTTPTRYGQCGLI